MASDYYLNPGMRDIIAARNATAADLRRQAGISQSLLSMMLAGQKAVSPRTRRALLGAPILQGIPESDIWSRRPASPPPAPDAPQKPASGPPCPDQGPGVGEVAPPALSCSQEAPAASGEGVAL